MTPTAITRARAFTLIELLIVVAIIAILAAIAVPNFLEAQTRSKISRTKTDMRTLATALEAYAADGNVYPNCHPNGVVFRIAPSEPFILERLTTPVAYVTSIGRDPFKISTRKSAADCTAIVAIAAQSVPDTDVIGKTNSYIYQSFNASQRYTLPPDGRELPITSGADRKARAWILHSAGPDSNYYNLGGVIDSEPISSLGACLGLIYDASNGTISEGSIFRANGKPGSSPDSTGGAAILAAIERQN